MTLRVIPPSVKLRPPLTINSGLKALNVCTCFSSCTFSSWNGFNINFEGASFTLTTSRFHSEAGGLLSLPSEDQQHVLAPIQPGAQLSWLELRKKPFTWLASSTSLSAGERAGSPLPINQHLMTQTAKEETSVLHEQ